MPIDKNVLSQLASGELKSSHLNLAYSSLIDSDIGELVKILEQRTDITSIDLSGNQISPLGIQYLASLNHLEELDISGNPIGDEGAIVLAQNSCIKVLSAAGCEIGIEGAMAFIENKVLEDLWLQFNKFDQRENDWIIKISFRLENNKAAKNPSYKIELEVAKKKIILEMKIQQAIKNEDINTLKSLLIEYGVNTRLKYGCKLLMYAIDENSLHSAEFLLKSGALIEDHERKLTPLFTAAEKGHLEAVELLLKYGANITGEFDFNCENALSIAAFKFCSQFMILLDKIDLNDFFQKIQKFIIPYYLIDLYEFLKHTNTNIPIEFLSWDKIIDVEKILPTILKEIFKDYNKIRDYWDEIYRVKYVPWISFSKNKNLLYDYTKSCLYLYLTLYKLFDYSHKYEQHLDICNNYAAIYKRISRKIDILHEKPPSTELDEQATDDEGDLELSHKIELLPDTENHPKCLIREELEKWLEQLNQELKDKTEKDVDWTKYPKFYIAQYRGIHYYRHHFTKAQRADHRRTIHLNRIAPAPAVYHMSGLYPTQHQIARESEIRKHKETVIEIFDAFSSSGKTTQYWGGKKTNFDSKSDMLQQRMSNSYEPYKKDIENQVHPTTKLLYDKKIIGYPHYATSDLPRHSLKYGYGQKKIGKEDQENNSKDKKKKLKANSEPKKPPLFKWRLRPIFQKNGKPLHPYPGKIYISLFNPLQMYLHKMRHVAGMHNRGKIKLTSNVPYERETSSPGGIEAETVFYEELLVIPSFRAYHESYKEKYGITNDMFNRFKKQILKSWTHSDLKKRISLRKSVKTNIIKTIMVHKEKQLLLYVQNEAKRRSGTLIYRHYDGTYGVDPEGLRIPKKKTDHFYDKREITLLNEIGEQRFMLNEDNNAFETCSEESINPDKGYHPLKKRKLETSSNAALMASVGNKTGSPLHTRNSLYNNILKSITEWEKLELEVATQLSLNECNKNVKQNLKEQALHYGFKCIDVKPDGNCFFHAVTHQLTQLNLPDLDDLNAISIKEKALHYILDHIDQYVAFFGEAKDAFMNKLLNGEWADQVFMHATAKALNITIAIIDSIISHEPKIINKNTTRATIYLGNEAVVIENQTRGLHYQSLERIPGLTPTKQIDDYINNQEVDNFETSNPVTINGEKELKEKTLKEEFSEFQANLLTNTKKSEKIQKIDELDDFNDLSNMSDFSNNEGNLSDFEDDDADISMNNHITNRPQ